MPEKKSHFETPNHCHSAPYSAERPSMNLIQTEFFRRFMNVLNHAPDWLIFSARSIAVEFPQNQNNAEADWSHIAHRKSWFSPGDSS